MDIQTVLLVILAALLALGIVLFQYYYKTKTSGKLTILLSFLRFLAFFGVFVLLINPKFIKNEYRLEKSDLIVLVDHSTSVASSSEDIQNSIKKIFGNEAIKKRFKLKDYGFGAKLISTDQANDNSGDTDDSLYIQKNTNITAALKAIQEIYPR